MKFSKYLYKKVIAVTLLMVMTAGFVACDDDEQDLGSGSLTNTVIQSVNVQNGNDWKETTQVKVGTKIRIEGNNLSTVSAAYFNGLEVISKDFQKQGNTYIEVAIPQNTPLGYQVTEESLKNTVKVKSDVNEFVFSLNIISWKLAVNGVRVFADASDLIGSLTQSAEIGSEIQIEGAGLNYVNKVYFNGYAVNVVTENHLASTALRVVISEETPLGDLIQDKTNNENVIKLETELGETYNYSFTITGPAVSVDKEVADTDGQPVTLITLGSDIVLSGTNLDLVKEVYCNGTKVTGFTATATSLTISVPADLPVGEGNVSMEDMNTIKLVSDYSVATVSIKFAGNAGSPFISGVSHTMAGAGEFIYIYGMNFEDIQKVVFPGEVETTDFEVIDSENIKVVVPSGGDQAPGYITVVSAAGEGYSYQDINCKSCLFLDFASVNAYAGSNQAKFDGVNLTMSGTNSASSKPFPVSNPDNAPVAPANYRIIPDGAARDITVAKISSDGDDLLKFRFDYGKVWSVVIANSGGSITNATMCSDLAMEFDFYMTCDWTLGAWRWETGKNSTDGDGRITLLPWLQNGEVKAFKFYGGWRTMVIPLSQLSCFEGLTVADATTAFPSSLNTFISLKAGNFKGADGSSSKGSDMTGYQLGFGNFRLVPYTKPVKK